MTDRPLVSVVTPAYNVAEYLRECIESVLAQTYTNWEYTIVNNASTDETRAIAREFAARDPRIRVVDNATTVPVIANHNIAFRQVSPQARYCKVVEGDDWIYPACLERMVALAEQHPSIAIVSAFSRVGADLDPKYFPFVGCVVSGRDACRYHYLADEPHLFGTATSLMYRADIVRSRHAFYNEPGAHADTESCLEFLAGADFGFVPEVLSFTRVREQSLTARGRDFNVYYSGKLAMVRAQGPKHLDAQEIAAVTRRVLIGYYDFLGREYLRKRSPEFWQYHSARLDQLGFPMSKGRLALGVLLALVERVQLWLRWQQLKLYR